MSERRVGGSFEKTNRFLFISGSDGLCEVDVEESFAGQPVCCERDLLVFAVIDDLEGIAFFCHCGVFVVENGQALNERVGQTAVDRADPDVSRLDEFDNCVLEERTSCFLMLLHSSKQIACAKWGSSYCSHSFLRMMSLKHRVLLMLTFFTQKMRRMFQCQYTKKSHFVNSSCIENSSMLKQRH